MQQSLLQPRRNNTEKVLPLSRRIIKNKYIYLILLPGIVFYAIFCYVPMTGIQLAFREFMINKGIWGSPWVGLEKFRLIFADDRIWLAVRNTLIISFGKILFCFPVPIMLALLINELREGKFKKTLQIIYTFPHFLSWVIISGIVLNIFNNTGAINNLLGVLGLPRKAFLADTALFRPLLFFTESWKEAGWSCIIYLAAIASINPEIYEAAYIDGANRYQRMINITWPEISSTVTILFLLSIGSIMNAGFDQIFNLYNPVVYDVADIIDTFIYRLTFQSTSDFGFSTAIGLSKSVVNMVLLLAANRAVKLFGSEGLI